MQLMMGKKPCYARKVWCGLPSTLITLPSIRNQKRLLGGSAGGTAGARLSSTPSSHLGLEFGASRSAAAPSEPVSAPFPGKSLEEVVVAGWGTEWASLPLGGCQHTGGQPAPGPPGDTPLLRACQISARGSVFNMSVRLLDCIS